MFGGIIVQNKARIGTIGVILGFVLMFVIASRLGTWCNKFGAEGPGGLFPGGGGIGPPFGGGGLFPCIGGGGGAVLPCGGGGGGLGAGWAPHVA